MIWLECTDKGGDKAYIPIDVVRKIMVYRNSYAVYYKNVDKSDNYVSILQRSNDNIEVDMNEKSVHNMRNTVE